MTHQARKRYGQHFLHDQSIIGKIIQAIQPEQPVPIVEIGPGLGALTIPLLKAAHTINAVEIDHELADILLEKCHSLGELHLHNKDALEFDFSCLFKEKIKIVGNLPYNISTPLLFHLLDQIGSIHEMLFMMQKEIVERICAKVNSRDYGRLTVMIQSQCEVKKLLDIGSGAFSPPPKVESSFVRLMPVSGKYTVIKNRIIFNEIVKQAFSQRRKIIRNALKPLIDESHFQSLGIASTARAENLGIEDYISIANLVHDIK